MVGLVSASAAAGLVVGAGVDRDGRSSAPEELGPETLTHAGVRLDLPPDWSPAGRASVLPGTRSGDGIAAEIASLPISITVGMLPYSSSTLLPRAFVRRLTAVPRPLVVRLDDGRRAYRYGPMVDRDARGVLDVLVAPTTGGVATVTCRADREVTALLTGCVAIGRSVSIHGARGLPLGPATAFWARLPDAIGALDQAQSREESAVERADQRAVGRLARAYARTAAALEPLAPPASPQPNEITQGLKAIGASYGDLAVALRRARRHDAVRSRAAILVRHERLAQALGRSTPAADHQR